MSFNEYYAYYLNLHQNRNCRRFHLLGMAVALAAGVYSWFTPHWWLSPFALLAVYPFAWAGHFFFERNTPATWKNPIRAGLSDLRMTWDICRGRIAA
jgi:hypothetical protein